MGSRRAVRSLMAIVILLGAQGGLEVAAPPASRAAEGLIIPDAGIVEVSSSFTVNQGFHSSLEAFSATWTILDDPLPHEHGEWEGYLAQLTVHSYTDTSSSTTFYDNGDVLCAVSYRAEGSGSSVGEIEFTIVGQTDTSPGSLLMRAGGSELGSDILVPYELEVSGDPETCGDDDAGLIAISVAGGHVDIGAHASGLYAGQAEIDLGEKYGIEGGSGTEFLSWSLHPAGVDPPDGDNDSVPDSLDNCPTIANPPVPPGLQPDFDADGAGDACDPDDDNDGILDVDDGCPFAPGACDADGDGLSDTKEGEVGTDPNDPDTDGDGLSDREEFVQFSDPLNLNDPHDWPTLDTPANKCRKAFGLCRAVAAYHDLSAVTQADIADLMEHFGGLYKRAAAVCTLNNFLDLFELLMLRTGADLGQYVAENAIIQPGTDAVEGWIGATPPCLGWSNVQGLLTQFAIDPVRFTQWLTTHSFDELLEPGVTEMAGLTVYRLFQAYGEGVDQPHVAELQIDVINRFFAPDLCHAQFTIDGDTTLNVYYVKALAATDSCLPNTAWPLLKEPATIGDA